MNNFMRLSILLGILLSGFNLAAAQQNQSKEVVKGELGVKLDGQMRQLAEKGFSGVLFVAKDGQIVLGKGYGAANKPPRSKLTGY